MKKTIVLILAAMMTVSMSSTIAYAADAADSKEVVKAKDSKKSKKQKGEVNEVTFLVHLHCENCVAKVFDSIIQRAQYCSPTQISGTNLI